LKRTGERGKKGRTQEMKELEAGRQSTGRQEFLIPLLPITGPLSTTI